MMIFYNKILIKVYHIITIYTPTILPISHVPNFLDLVDTQCPSSPSLELQDTLDKHFSLIFLYKQVSLRESCS